MKSVKKFTAKFVAVAMVVLTAAGVGVTPEKHVNAAELSSYLNVEYGIKYTGETDAKVNSAGNAWDIQYFNVANSAFETGDAFYVSAKISGASNFKQVAIQTGLNNWDWSSAPKRWSETGIADDTVVAGKVVATKDGDNVSFKIQFDNVVDTEKTADAQKITLTDLYIMPIGKGTQEAVDMPESKLLDLGTKYSGTVTANKNDDVYEAQYFNVKDSAFSTGDTYIISYTLGGATQFKQVATQSSLNSWGWGDAVKVWSGEGLAEEQNSTGAITATSSGDGVAFKIRLDTLVDAEKAPGESIDLTLTDLIVVKVANNDVVTLPSNLMISKDRTYTGSVDAVKDDANWVVQYFNVKDTSVNKGDLIEVNFEISGASAFKQLAVQSNLDGWAWDSAPKMWQNNGIKDSTKFSAIIEATKTVDENIAFKLWLDNPVDADFDKESVAIELKNLQVKDFTTVDSLNDAYEKYFTVGAAVSADKMDDAGYKYRAREVFGTITAENAMKPDALLNKTASQAACEGDVDGDPVLNLEYSGMTKILDFAKEKNLKVRGHALVYAAQTPDWFFKEGYQDDGKFVKSDVMTKRLDSYIQQVVEFVEENYPDVVTCWDVVNEAFDNDGNYVQNNWTKTIGESYVADAFNIAKSYVKDKNVKLYYNDYNMENIGKQQAIELLMFDAPIDGVGMQEHATLNYPAIADVSSAIDAYAKMKLDVQITELDVQIDESDSLTEQATRYGDLFTLFKEKSDSISNVTVWGINDGDSWKDQKRPLLFFDDLSPKPAFNTVLDVAN